MRGSATNSRMWDCWLKRLLRNNQLLTDRKLFRIADIFSVRLENLFPTLGRFIKFSRNGEERVAGPHNVGSACLLRGGFLRACIACLRFLRASPQRSGARFNLFAQI